MITGYDPIYIGETETSIGRLFDALRFTRENLAFTE